MSGGALAGAAGRSVRIGARRYPVLLPTVGDPRLHLASVIIALQVLGQVGLRFQVSIAQILIAIGTAGVLEVAIALWRSRVLMWPASALLTGNGVAFVLRVPGTAHGDWWSLRGAWIFAATAALGVLSKHVIRVRGRHIFNPSNIALVACFLILGSGRADPLNFWWGPMDAWLAVATALILLGGLVILSRLRMLAIAVAFWLAFASGLAVLALSGHAMTASWHLGPITGFSFWWIVVSSPEILVFLFFMITDPKTVPRGGAERVAYAVAVGLVAALLIAPATSEFATKVAVLGALAIVCLVLPATALRSRVRALGHRFALAVALGGAYVAVLVAVGGGSSVTASVASTSGSPGRLPAITIVPNADVSTQLEHKQAVAVARKVLSSLALASQALRRRDPRLAARAGSGAWLASLRRQIRSAHGGAIVVPSYRVAMLSMTLAQGNDQAPPTITVTMTGTLTRTRYANATAAPTILTAAAPLHQALKLAPAGSGYEIVALVSTAAVGRAVSPRNIGLELALARRGWAPQGEPFTLNVALRNSAVHLDPVTVELTLTDPHGSSTPVYHNVIYVPGTGQTTQRVSFTPSQWFGSLGSYSVSASVDRHRAGVPLRFRVTPARVVVPRFEDVTVAAGLATAVPAPGCGEFVTSPAWGAIAPGGPLDLFMPRLRAPAELFIGDGRGHFASAARARGVAVTGAVAGAFGDYLGNGLEDLFVARYGAPSILFRNDGNGHFTNVTRASGIGSALEHASSVTWVDYNGDGRLDLYVTQYPSCVGPWTSGTDTLPTVRYHPSKLYRNNGDGTFTDVSSLLGGSPTGAGMAAAWFDARGSGHQDLYLGNDLVGQAPVTNQLWLGRRARSFVNASSSSGTGLYMNTMGIAVADLERNGRLDLALSNIGGNKLLRNNGDGTFTDIAPQLGVARPTQTGTYPAVTWGVGAYDFTLDGWEDLYFSAGDINPRFAATQGPQPSELFVNDAGRGFLDLSAASGAANAGDAKGVAFADYTRDGRIDMFVVDQAGAPHLYRNVTPYGRNHWLEVAPVGTVSNRDGCGARVLAVVKGATLLREVRCGGDERIAHFGLGTATRVARLQIDWPSGVRQVLRNVAVDRYLTVTEPRP